MAMLEQKYSYLVSVSMPGSDPFRLQSGPANIRLNFDTPLSTLRP